MIFVLSKQLHQSQYDKDCILCFLPEVLFLYLTFRSIIHFKLNYVYDVKSQLLFIFLPCRYTIVPVTFIEKSILPTSNQVTLYSMWVYSWNLHYLKLILMSFIKPIQHYINNFSIIVNLAIGNKSFQMFLSKLFWLLYILFMLM